MARDQLNHVALCCLLLAAMAWPATAGADDSGLIVSATAEKKINKKAGAEFEAEFRSRNGFRTVDRLSMGVTVQYKLTNWLKADAGYQLLIDNNMEKISRHYDDDGTFSGYNNWRPSYWGTRQRLYASLSASIKWQRVSFSLRERYRYTYRPATTTNRYDFDNGWWEDVTLASKHRHVLRSSLKVQWDIPKSKFTPSVSAEVFNSMSFDKLRLQAGVDYTLKKTHTFTICYRYQDVFNEDEDENDTHYLGLGYKFKF